MKKGCLKKDSEKIEGKKGIETHSSNVNKKYLISI